MKTARNLGPGKAVILRKLHANRNENNDIKFSSCKQADDYLGRSRGYIGFHFV